MNEPNDIPFMPFARTYLINEAASELAKIPHINEWIVNLFKENGKEYPGDSYWWWSPSYSLMVALEHKFPEESSAIIERLCNKDKK